MLVEGKVSAGPHANEARIDILLRHQTKMQSILITVRNLGSNHHEEQTHWAFARLSGLWHREYGGQKSEVAPTLRHSAVVALKAVHFRAIVWAITAVQLDLDT
jgi:hypothetical protein